TFYPEKRPFFLEDRSVFELATTSGVNPLFYTRRIGRAPRSPDEVGDEALVAEPPVPAIYAAAKLAGQTEDGLSLGLIQAVTSEEQAVFERPDGRRLTRVAEPLSSFTVARLKTDFWDHSSAGLMLLGLATPEDGAALSGGVDTRLELGGPDYHLLANALWSYLTPERVPWHDDFTRAGVERDGPLGYGGELALSKDGGEYVTGQARVRFRSRSLALNDLGYLDRPDVIEAVTTLQHRRLQPLGDLSRYSLTLNFWLRRNQAGQALGQGFWVDAWSLWKDAWGLGVWFGVDAPTCDDRETRTAGEVVFCLHEPWIGGGLYGTTDPAAPVAASLDLTASNTERGWGLSSMLVLAIHPWERLQLSLEPTYRRWRGSLVWVDTLASAGGERLVFADRHSETWDVTLRGSLTLARDFTFQLYTQVYLVSVDHREKLAAPRPSSGALLAEALAPALDVPDDYDQRYSAWNLNAVLRWEFAPGSVGFLVYTLGLAADGERAEFRFGRSLDELVQAAGQHVLMLKLSYLFG
ncbi:MAG TPA: DUF5916 domain-containing protein, partial [Myxococcota bacterium]|nr:DUF5916 domain-containing protein [Myxococcota bacterium]